MDRYPPRPIPMLADNDKTVEFLIKMAGKDPEKLKEIKDWGEKRQVRIERLCGFAGFLQKHDILDIDSKEMSRIAFECAFHHCVAIASKHGFDMEYTFNDSESGPLAAALTTDIHAVRPNRSIEGLFANVGQEAGFLEAVAGKNPDELAELARELVIEEAHRMIILPQR